MEGFTATQFLWATIIVGGIIGIVVLTRAPELLVVILLVGGSYIQNVFWLFGFHISRRSFATAGAVIFLPAVLLFMLMRMVGTREREPIIGRPNFSFIASSVLMGIVFLIGLTFTLAPRYGTQKTGEYFIFGIAPMFLSFVFLRDHASVRRFFMWLLVIPIATILISSAYNLVARGTLFAILYTHEGAGEFEIAGHGGLSGSALVVMSAILALAAGRQETKWKALPLIALPVVAFYILFAGTRSNLAAFLFVIVVGYFFAYKGKRKVLAVVLLLMVVTTAVLTAVAPEEVSQRMLASWFSPETQPGTAFMHREELALGGLKYSLEAPVLGHGTGGWPMLEYGLDVYDYPHNMAAEILVENGLVGVAVFLALWTIVLRRIWRYLRDEEVGTELYGLAVFGACLMAMEFFTGMAHFGLAHSSCTLLISSAIILRTTFLAEHARASEEQAQTDTGMLVQPVLKAGPL